MKLKLSQLSPLTAQIVKAGLVSASLVSAYAIQAQTQAPEKTDLGRVIVTGSNIKRIDAEGLAPVQTITREEIERSPKATVGELLRDITANTGGSSSETSTNNQSGAAGISLRGLGQKSTLVLINGRRMANHAFAQNGQDTFVDLNAIPKSAVQRIEVLKDGASAIYGSDAIAGVVNIILRKDFKGLELGGTVGKSTQGGLGETTLSLAGGMNALQDKLNVMAVLDVFKRDLLLLSDRPWLNGLDFRAIPGGTYFPAASGGTWQRTVFAPVFALKRQALPNCLGGSTPQDALIGAGVYSGTSCTYNVDKYLTAFPEADRLGLFSRAVYQLSPTTDLFAEFSLSDNKSNWINQPQTVTNATVAFNPTTGGFSAFPNIIPNIPFYAPLNATNTLGGVGTSARLNYTFFDVGARTFDLETKTYRAVAGLNGSGGGWDWQVAIGKAQSKIVSTTGNQVDAVALRTFIDKGGYNFLAPTAEQTAALRVSTTRNGVSDLSFIDAKVSTELTRLPAGPLGFAAGIEARTETLSDIPDPLSQQGRLIGTGSSRTDGSRNAQAAFVEFNLPATQELEFQLAARADHYSDFGSAFSPKVGLKYTATPQLLFRASVATGFRAPTLVENANSASLGFDSVLDPLRANASTVIGVLNTGSKVLEAETSKSSSFGAVFEPVKDLSIGLDFYRIEQKNLVSLNGAQFIVRNPALFPGAVIRDPATNTILVVYDNYSNQANVTTNGIDLDARARLPASDMGRFSLRFGATYLQGWNYKAKPTSDAVDYAGRNDGPNGALPTFKARAGLDMLAGAFAGSVNLNYISNYEQRNAGASADPFVGASTTVDVYASYNVVKNGKLSLSISNLFDRQPPWDIATGVGIANSQYDLRGRYVRLGGDYKF